MIFGFDISCLDSDVKKNIFMCGGFCCVYVNIYIFIYLKYIRRENIHIYYIKNLFKKKVGHLCEKNRFVKKWETHKKVRKKGGKKINKQGIEDWPEKYLTFNKNYVFFSKI